MKSVLSNVYCFQTGIDRPADPEPSAREESWQIWFFDLSGGYGERSDGAGIFHDVV